MNNIDLSIIDHLINRCIKEKLEATIDIEPNRTEIRISPWEPFKYNCPYNTEKNI